MLHDSISATSDDIKDTGDIVEAVNRNSQAQLIYAVPRRVCYRSCAGLLIAVCIMDGRVVSVPLIRANAGEYNGYTRHYTSVAAWISEEMSQ